MKFKFYILVGTVEADNLEQAKKIADEELENYAGSNDGSEILANAHPIVRPITDETLR